MTGCGAPERRDDPYQAERDVAAERGEQYADVVDIGAAWDAGAPLPHLLAGPRSTYVVCHAGDTEPGRDEPARAAADAGGSPLLVIEIVGCRDVRMGGPNDETVHGHPLHGRGLIPYGPHVVRNSEWLASAIRVDSVHPYHSDEAFRRLHHFVLTFHDETVEALGEAIRVTPVVGTIRAVLTDLVSGMTSYGDG